MSWILRTEHDEDEDFQRYVLLGDEGVEVIEWHHVNDFREALEDSIKRHEEQREWRGSTVAYPVLSTSYGIARGWLQDRDWIITARD